MRDINHIRHYAVLLLLLLIEWAVGYPLASQAQNTVTIIPDPETNLVGEGDNAKMQPVEMLLVDNYNMAFTFSAGTAGTAPAYYANGSALRLYRGNTMSLGCAEGEAVQKIVFQIAKYKENEKTLTASTGTVTYNADSLNYTWVNTNKEDSVTFSIQGTQLRIKGLKLTIAKTGETIVRPKAPAFSQKSCDFYKEFQLTITDLNDPAQTIRYTLDGTEPTAKHGNIYTEPITIPEGNDITVKAVAVRDTVVSQITSATYHFIKKYLLTVESSNKNAFSEIYVSSNSNYISWQSSGSTYIAEGEDVYIGYNLYQGYTIKGITLNGEAVEGLYETRIKMPAFDVKVAVDVFFNPSSPSDPLPDDNTKYYNLTLVCNPTDAGTTNNSGKYKAGQGVYVSTSRNSGYVFTGWTKDGETINTNSGFNYIMPASDVVLTANYVYNPTSPSDPQQPALMHPLTVIASPAGSATFNTSGSKVKFGDNYYVNCYPSTGYKFKGWILNGVALENTSTTISGTMTDAGAHLVALCVFDPSSPENPGANYYNPTTGQVIIDDFQTGNLYNTLYSIVGYNNYENVSSIIVKGRVNNNDIGSLNYLKNAQTIDISRTGGYTNVYYNTFQDMAVANIVFPASVTNFDGYVFSGCANLTAITIYAQEPPICSYNTFENFTNKDNCTIFVPAEAVDLYANAKYWKDFTILPINNDTHVLQVNLPAEAKDGKYKHYSLELVNINSGVRQKYVISDRLLYTFNGLQKDEQYNIYMHSSSGLEIGRIENVIIPDNDLSVTFENLKTLHEVKATVLAADGSNVTEQATIEWLRPLADGTITYLRKAVSLGEIPDGQQLICRVTLDSKLGTVYATPADVELTVSNEQNSCTINLIPFRSIVLTGTIVDGDGTTLADASVSLSQTLNGKYEVHYAAKTDANGKWTATVLEAPETRITYAATECVNVNDTIAAFAEDVATLDLGKTKMKSIVGARVNYSFTYHAAGAENTETYYSDYKNVAISVYNITQQRAHNSVSMQYPVLAVLDDNIQIGDTLLLVATSKTGAFNPIETKVIIGENQRAEVVFDIIGKGSIAASYQNTENPAVIAMLYSAKGELVKKQTYVETATTFTELEDGNYTLVTMGQTDLMNSILRLANFDEIGLKDGKDYVKTVVNVESGKLAEVKLTEVPAFDESLFYYTNSQTSFSANKSSITTGAFLTLRSTIDFKGIYKADISNVALVVDLPEACDYVEKSVIQGPNLLPYTIDNNRLTIQLGNNYQTLTRFCVIPTTGGEFNATASITFDYNGRTITQPIGSASAVIKDIEICVPSVTASPKFKVAGTALANSEVKIMENGIALGTGKANAAGLWNVECQLQSPYNLSTHSIMAEITTPQGNKLASETKTITYDMNALQVAKVTMYHYNPEMNKTYTSEFDFMNPKTAATQWTVYYPKKVFTYTIEFTDNDPERIFNVVLYIHTADGRLVPCNALYNKQKQLWYAEVNMGNSSDGYYPVNCSVDFDYKAENAKVDKREISDANTNDSQFMTSYTSLVNNVKQLVENATDMTDEQWNDFFTENGLNNEVAAGNIDVPTDYDQWSEQDKTTFVDNITNDMNTEMNAMTELLDKYEPLFTKNSEYGDVQFADGSSVSVKTCDNITADELIAQGFTAYDCIDSTVIYTLITNEKGIFVDLANNLYIETRGAMSQTVGNEFVELLKQLKESFGKWDNNNAAKCVAVLKEVKSILENANVKFSDALTAAEDDMTAQASAWLAILNTQQGKYQQLISIAPTTELAQSLRHKLNAVMAKKAVVLKFKSSIRPAFRLISRTLPFEEWITATANLMGKAEDLRLINILIDNKLCMTDVQRTAFKARSKKLLERVGKCASDNIITVAINDAELFVDMLGCIKTGGIVIGAGVQGFVVKAIALSSTLVIDKTLDYDIKLLWAEVNAVSCPETDKDQKNNKTGGTHKSGSVNDNVQIDPSGFVYEAVPTNRIEGVQASIYYKETVEDQYGDPHENIVLWNAEDYAQKNPLFTDENGMYRWDVPQGLWQVKFEKDGYITAYSEWLPVPPPQLEVNVAITQNKQPEVVEARAYEEGVEVQFDKFMNEETLTASNIFVTANGTKLNGEIRFVDSALADEFASEDDAAALRYASRVRFVPEQPLSVTTGEIRLTVSRNVMSYANIPMTETYTQVLDVEKEVQQITADDVKVVYGEEKTIIVHTIPFEAAVGKTLHVANSSALIASIENTEAVIDAEGKALIKVKGDLPGSTQLTFSINDVTVTGQCAVDVVTEILTAVTPTSSRASGTAVYRGTKIELATESKNGVIYFTTDGSCPCDENGSRRKYTVPIVINGDVQIKAMTTVNNGEDVSETAEFNYTLKRSNIDFEMAEGWTWMSHNFDTELSPSALTTNVGISRILSQTQELVRDPQLGMVGTLTAMTAAESYKVETTTATNCERITDYAWNPATPIAIKAGWNWLGYPVAQTMSVDEAFATTAAERLDVVVGQKGFAQFDGEHWIGTLETMSPGLGYMYQSASDKNIVYNTNIVSTAAAKSVQGISTNLPLALDIHKYGQIMPVVATIMDANGMSEDNADYQVAAFCGSECRGIGKVVSGLVMMNVYGNTGDNITFNITDRDGDTSFGNNASMSFSETVVGDIFNPYPLVISQTTGIGAANYDGNVKLSVVGDNLLICGIAPSDIRMVEIFDLSGHKVLRTNNVSESGISISALTGGVYVVVVDGNGEYTYHKIAIR